MVSPPSSASDLDQRDRIVGGSREAAEAFFRAHLDGLYEFVHYRVGGDRAAAEDVVQDTFLTALRRIHTFDGRSSLHTWLCGIAKNRIRTERRVRRPMPLAEVLVDADAEIDTILCELERVELPESVLERRETQELVGATLSSLPPDYKAALLEKYVEGLSVAEMAVRRGRGQKATESLLTRARAAFARVFELLSRRRGGIV